MPPIFTHLSCHPALARRASLLSTLCLLCGQWVPLASRFPELCDHCLQALPWNHTGCERCGLPVERCGHACGNEFLERTVCPLLYEAPAARWVIRGKHHSGTAEASALGRLLASVVAERYDPADLPDTLMPVPLSWRRLFLRGHNQALLLARRVGQQLQIPIDRHSIRRRHTPIQPGRSAARRARNVAGIFTTRVDWGGRRVAIVDDVMTSGATVASLARCLKDAGAVEVHAWCATRAIAT